VRLTGVQERILNAVLLRANQTEGNIAQALGVREGTVRRAIAAFHDAKILHRRSIYINPHALGLLHYLVSFSVPVAAHRGREKFLELLCAAEEVMAVVELSGEAQFEVRMYVRSSHHLMKFFDDLAARSPCAFRVESSLLVTEQEYSGVIDPEIAPEEVRTLHYRPLSPNEPVYALDSKDHAILFALSNAPYLRISQVARHLSLPVTTVGYRIQALENAGVIKGHFYIINPHTFHEIPVCLVVKSRGLTAKERETLRAFCRRHPKIAWITFFIGHQSAEIYLRVKNYAEASRVVSDLSHTFDGVLGSIHMTTQLQFFKYSTYPFKNYSSVVGR